MLVIGGWCAVIVLITGGNAAYIAPSGACIAVLVAAIDSTIAARIAAKLLL